MKRLRRRQYDPVIIEMTIGLVLCPFTALYRSFLGRCTLTNRTVGTIWWALSCWCRGFCHRTESDLFLFLSSEATGSWSPFPLIVSRDSFSLWIWARLQNARSTSNFNGCHYIFLIYHYITIYDCVPHFCDLSALVGCWSSVFIRRIIYKFLNKCPFDCTAVAVSGKVDRS